MRYLPLALLAAVAVAAPASASELESPDRATPIDVDRGRVLFSQRGPDGKFRLALHPASGARYTLDVPPQGQPFDADLGNDASGQPVAVYESCPTGPRACDIRVHRLTTGVDAPIAAAAKPGVNEQAPTVSKGRVVWATVVGQGSDGSRPTGRPRVLTQMLDSSAAPTTLPGLPARRCREDFDGKRFCERPEGQVMAQELHGDRLAQVVASSSPKLGLGAIEVRLVGVGKRTSTQLMTAGAGESGQSFVGPTFQDGRLYWYFACFGDPSGCDRSGGIYRYAPGAKRLERALDPAQVSGFGVDGGKVYVSEGSERKLCEIEQGDYPGLAQGVASGKYVIGPCPITARPLPTSWKRYSPRQ